MITLLPLAIALIASFSSFETYGQESNVNSTSEVTQASPTVKNNPVKPADNSAAKRPAATTKENTDAVKESNKKALSADNNDDEQNAPDPAEILKAIRKNFAAKHGLDKVNDNLIVSQSSSYIFLNRKKIRDVTENILDHWYLSSFEDDFNLTRIEFEAVVVKPTVINLDLDIESLFLLNSNDNSMLSNSGIPIVLSHYTNFPIPESVMEMVGEISEEIESENVLDYIPEALSKSSIVVMFLALLGLTILSYIIYKIIVWLFMLDQNRDYDLQKGRDDDVVVPVNMDAFKEYFFQEPDKDK